jgi:hypothetical protein
MRRRLLYHLWQQGWTSTPTRFFLHSGGLQPGAALVVVRLAVVTLPPRSTAPAVAGCRLVGCSVVSGRPMRSRAVAGVSQRVRVGLGPVLAVFWPPVPRRPPGGGGVGFPLRGGVWAE